VFALTIRLLCPVQKRTNQTPYERDEQESISVVIDGASSMRSDRSADPAAFQSIDARDDATQMPGLGKLVGACPSMLELFSRIKRVAPTSVGVLITGESGTGKELVAETIHELSGRRSEPFIAVNCGAIPATLVEAELFGHERGSFTGAIRSQAGYFERAGQGTLFLDEAAEMPLDMQVKLLRALESRSICRVGGDREIPLHARVIAATNRTLSEAVSNNHLRADLLYRLAVFHMDLPALRHRDDDVSLLARHFLDRLNRTEGTDKYLSADSLAYLREHDWPGNVRELYNTVQRAFILADDQLELRGVAMYGPGALSTTPAESGVAFKPGMSLSEVERMVIVETLKCFAGNKTRTAAVLGISLKTLYNRLNEYRALE
jgi:two-component system, NtrC family, response regulator HydG